MTRTTEVNVMRALVATLRAQNAAFTAAVSSVAIAGHTWDSQRIHEGTAPAGTEYPFLTYSMVYAPYDDDWGKRTLRVAFDISAWSDNQVEANTLDSLVMTTVEDSLATVDGQTTLYARRTDGLRLPEVDETGTRIFRAGGTYVIWTDQPL
jgi:hypothetical protein